MARTNCPPRTVPPSAGGNNQTVSPTKGALCRRGTSASLGSPQAAAAAAEAQADYPPSIRFHFVKMPPIVPQNHCHSVVADLQHNATTAGTKQLRIVSSRHSSVSFRSKSRSSGQREAAAVSPARLSNGDRNALLCWCCIRRQDKAVPSPPPSASSLGSPVMTMAPAQNGAGGKTTTACPPVELSVLKLNGVTERQQKKQQQRKKKARSSTFSASPASRGIFPRLHRSLSSQQQHKLFRVNAPAHPPPPLDLRALDAADGTPNNTTDYLEVGRAEGGWIRDANFWSRQQEFWQMQQNYQQQQGNTVDHGDGNTVVVVMGQQDGTTVDWDSKEEQQQNLDMETARTSRTEDIVHYPSMDTLIDQILLTDSSEEMRQNDDDNEFKQYTNTNRTSAAKATADGSPDEWTTARNGSSGGCELEAVVPCHPSPCSSSTASSSTSGCSPTRNSPSTATVFSATVPLPPAVPPFGAATAPSAFPPAVFFTATASDLFMSHEDAYGCGTAAATGGGSGAAVAARRQTALAVPARPRPLGALPALTQSLFDAFVVTYVWVASSLALIVQWFL
ncbi:hypothetical protein niasHT_030805 [Heterodera trifolii]|uniref:Uncharacterized protein n=1 Tax=Heterodera trifolii TaxID=157864 RepID=A0ABD2HNZ6_9BILA